jgi:hypothetical protein
MFFLHEIEYYLDFILQETRIGAQAQIGYIFDRSLAVPYTMKYCTILDSSSASGCPYQDQAFCRTSEELEH